MGYPGVSRTALCGVLLCASAAASAGDDISVKSCDAVAETYKQGLGRSLLQRTKFSEPELKCEGSQELIENSKALLPQVDTVRRGRDSGESVEQFKNRITPVAEELTLEIDDLVRLYGGKAGQGKSKEGKEPVDGKKPKKSLKGPRDQDQREAAMGTADKIAAALGPNRIPQTIDPVTGGVLAPDGGQRNQEAITRAENGKQDHAYKTVRNGDVPALKGKPPVQHAPTGGIAPADLAKKGWKPENVAELEERFGGVQGRVEQLHARSPSAVADAYRDTVAEPAMSILVNIDESRKFVQSGGDYNLGRGCISHQQTVLGAFQSEDSNLVAKPIMMGKGLEHHAVVVYPRGTDWNETGIVLDPWKKQSPEPTDMTFGSVEKWRE